MMYDKIKDLWEFMKNPYLSEFDINEKLLSINGLEWSLVGHDINKNLTKQNAGPIEKNSDGLSIFAELFANMGDASYDLEWFKHGEQLNDMKMNQTQAAYKWFGVPKKGLHLFSTKERRALAEKVGKVTIRPNSFRFSKHGKLVAHKIDGTYDVRDYGIGQLPNDFTATLLSLLESNKQLKNYLTGSYGFGGASSFDKEFCTITFIASKKYGSDRVGFTIVLKRQPDKNTKGGQYYYCTIDGQIPEIKDNKFTHGTLKRHYRVNISTLTKSTQGRGNAYNAFSYIMPATKLPFILVNGLVYPESLDIYPKSLDKDKIKKAKLIVEKNKHTSSNTQVIYGVFDKLTGLKNKLSTILYSNSTEGHISGINGKIGIFWFVFPKENKSAQESYVNSDKPIIFSDGGQHRGSLQKSTFRHSGISYIRDHLVVFVITDNLKYSERQKLFNSNRESMNRKYTNDLAKIIRMELLNDGEIEKINNQFRDDEINSISDNKFGNYDKSLISFLGGIEKGIKVGRSSVRNNSITIPPLPDMIVNEPPAIFNFARNKPIRIVPGRPTHITCITDANPNYIDHIDSNNNKITFEIIHD